MKIITNILILILVFYIGWQSHSIVTSTHGIPFYKKVASLAEYASNTNERPSAIVLYTLSITILLGHDEEFSNLCSEYIKQLLYMQNQKRSSPAIVIKYDKN